MKQKFPFFTHHPELIYLDSAATAHKPTSVIEAILGFYSAENGTVHRAIYQSAVKAEAKYHRARETIRCFLNAASVDEIIFTRGTTDALNLVAQSYGRTFLKKGDEILLSEAEHHSNIVPWQLLAQEKGIQLRWIPVEPDGTLTWKGKITPRTKLVCLAHISNVTGTVNPIREIAFAAHAVGAVICIDGAQGAPHTKVDVQELGCDFYAFSGHKCYGPTGIGVLYGKKDLLEKMPPIQGGGDMIEKVELTGSTYQMPPLRFEAGTPIIGPAIGLMAALEFLMEIGLDKIEAHGKKLRALFETGLKSIEGVKILGKAVDKGPLTTFYVEGLHPLDIATLLDLKHIAIRSGHLCAQPLLKAFGLKSVCRASFGIYNTEKDVHETLKALQEVLLGLNLQTPS